MIKGLAITPPILGRISIGSVIEKNGKRLPVKEDFFYDYFPGAGAQWLGQSPTG